ncbi:MAG: hypothetical protein K2O44_02345 [Clostridia bacterium]|nr:hypothetical protein [Clostridia bacterium]
MTVKGKTGALIAASAAIIAGVGVSGCADKKAALPHEHTYSESEWMQDDAGHWRGALCGHKVRKDYGEHIYDNAFDADCNVCGRIRKIEENKDPAESNGGSPDENKGATDEKTEGFIIGKNTDGLTVEGISAEYALNREYRAVNFDSLSYAVYLCENGVKCEEVPRENYQTTVYYGSNEVLTPQELTADGQYTAVVKLVGAVYADGGKADENGLTAQIKFTVKNGVETFSMTEGKTEQVASVNDKMSATWKFEGVRANGDAVTFWGSEAEMLPPDTETVGTHTATVKYGGAESEIKYTVKPVPEIVNGGVDITAKGGLDIQTDGDFVVINLDDFNVEYSVNAGYTYSVKTALVYLGTEADSIELEADGSNHLVTVRVTFAYTVEGERVTRGYTQAFGITVSKRQEDENLPIAYSGAEIAAGDGVVHLNVQDGAAVNVRGETLEIKNISGEYGQSYSLVINADKPATVIVNLCAEYGALCGVARGGDKDDGQYIEGYEELTFEFSPGGENSIYILSLSDSPNAVIKIYGVEILYGPYSTFSMTPPPRQREES